MREALKRNIWQFSVAKNYNDNIRLNNLLLRPDGSVRPWNEFKREAQFVVGTSNRYLKTEYDTIVAVAQMSRLWQEIQRDKHIFPFVQFDVVQDDHTSEICSPLHGVIMSVDDPSLAFYFPPNHFNCRTTVRKLRNGIPTQNVNLPDIPEAFQNNIGETGKIFTKNNRYIENTSSKILKEADELYKEAMKDASLEFRKKLEQYKLKYPLYEKTNHPNVEVSLWADRTETKRNIEIAKAVADFDQSQIKVRPHIDGEVLLKVPNPEYLVNNMLADRKSPQGLNLINLLRKAHNDQNCEVVILDMENNNFSVEEIYKEVVKKLKMSTNYPRLKTVYVISKDLQTVIKYER